VRRRYEVRVVPRGGLSRTVARTFTRWGAMGHYRRWSCETCYPGAEVRLFKGGEFVVGTVNPIPGYRAGDER